MLPKSLLSGIYSPTFTPEKLDHAEFSKQLVEQEVASSPIVKMLTSADIPKPLTLDEAKAIDKEVDQLRGSIKTTRDRIAVLQGVIDNIGQGTNTSGQELSFKLDIKDRSQLKRAIKAVFGLKTNTITYSMYKAAIEAKRNLEKEEASDYVNLKW